MYQARWLPVVTIAALVLAGGAPQHLWAQATKAGKGSTAPSTDSVVKVFLTDLPEKNARVGWGTFGKHGTLGDPQGTKIVVRGVPYEKGLGMSPDHASVEYVLDKKYRTFRSLAAINGTGGGSRPVIFVIEGDGIKLWESRGLRDKGERIDAIADVTDVSVLRLRVFYHPAESGGSDPAHSVWLNPCVETEPPVGKVLPFPTPSQLARGKQLAELVQLLKAQLKASRFEELERTCSEALKKGGLLSGRSPMAVIINCLDQPNQQTEAGWQQHLELLRGWEADYPQSKSCLLVTASSWLGYGWMARGTGYAADVSQDNWQLFRSRAAKGAEALERYQKLGVDDPQYHVIRMNLATADPVSLGALRKEFEAGKSLKPFDPSIALEYAARLLPRWGGRVTDASQLADELLKENPDGQGAAIYARIAASVFAVEGTRTFTEMGFTYEKFKPGAVELVRNIPESERLTQMFCAVACNQQDKKFANALFTRFGDTSWHNDIWYLQKYVDSWRRWAASGAPSPDELKTLYVGRSGLLSFAINRDCSKVFTGSDTEDICEIDLASGQVLRSIRPASSYVRSLVRHPVENGLAYWCGTARSNSFAGRYLKLDEPKSVREFVGPKDDIAQLAFSEDGQYLAAVGIEKQAFVWKSNKLSSLQKLDHPEGLYSVTFLQDGRLITSTREGGLFAWDLSGSAAKHQVIRDVRKGPWFCKIAALPDEMGLLLGAQDGTVEVVSLAGERIASTPQRRQEPIHCVAVSPNGKLAAAGCRSGTIELYSLPKLELVHSLKGHFAKVNAIQFTPSGDRLISASDDCTLKLWQVPAAGKQQPGNIANN
jgi:hypothetical protein